MIIWHLKKTLLLIGILCINLPINPKAQLTFLHNGGRLGDVYLNTLLHIYLAQKYNLDLRINTTIPHLQHFTIGTMYSMKELHKKKRLIKHENDLTNPKNNVLYVSTINTVIHSLESDYYTRLFKLYLENDTFRQLIKQFLSLRRHFGNSKLPHGVSSVAVHIRKGSGPDGPLQSPQYRYISDFHYPLKFPPEQYYVDQIIFLKQLIHQEPLYVRIFTDDKNPYELTKRIQEKINNPSILFDYQQNSSEIEDLSDMSHFDILIRSSSHFGCAAQFIGKHKAIIMPTHYQWEQNYLHITASTILIPDHKQYTLHAIPATIENIERIRGTLQTISS